MTAVIRSAVPQPNFRLELRYEDGVSGTVDLSRFAGKGVFRLWDRPGEFEKVRISEDGAIAWGEDIEICPDALYLEITGKKPEDLLPGMLHQPMNA